MGERVSGRVAEWLNRSSLQPSFLDSIHGNFHWLVLEKTTLTLAASSPLDILWLDRYVSDNRLPGGRLRV